MDTSGRLLRLLSLLQARGGWTGPELADRCGVTNRTLRRDVNRLRDLGYAIIGEPGPMGGYRLGAGGALPPLLLDDAEAVTVALRCGEPPTVGCRGWRTPLLSPWPRSSMCSPIV